MFFPVVCVFYSLLRYSRAALLPLRGARLTPMLLVFTSVEGVVNSMVPVFNSMVHVFTSVGVSSRTTTCTRIVKTETLDQQTIKSLNFQ